MNEIINNCVISWFHKAPDYHNQKHNMIYLRAILCVSTEEHCLSPMISKAISSDSWKIATLGVISANTGVIILGMPGCSDVTIILCHLFKPVRVRQWQVRESSLPLHKVPGSPDIIIPRYHPLYRVTHHVHIYWHGKVKPANKQI